MLSQQPVLYRLNKSVILVLSRSKKWYKKKEHWAEARRKNKPSDKAMEHFDEFYSSVFGEKKWRSIRVALLCPNKYCAVVNNYGDPDASKQFLENRGAINLKQFLQLGKERVAAEEAALAELENADAVTSESAISIDRRMQQMGASTSQYTTFYYEGADGPEEFKLQYEEETTAEANEMTKVNREKVSLEESMTEAELDENRIIDPSNPLSVYPLYEFIPAYKLHGMDNWIPESEYYNFYKKNMDFPITVEEDEQQLTIPENLNIYLYEKCNNVLFPSPEKVSTNVLNYYILNGSSVLPVLALDLKQGDNLLDMCASPGGKSITAIQSLCLDKVTLNDKDYMRMCKLYKVVNEYLYNTDFLRNAITITRRDALTYSNQGEFNKILIDVPCTNDREVLKNKSNSNIFHSIRIKERLRLPEVQSELLTCALKLIPVQGIVVYSTCSLSPVQNDGVIQMALRKLWEETNYRYIVKNIKKTFKPLEMAYCLGSDIMKYGSLVYPNMTANFGPLYISKIVRVR